MMKTQLMILVVSVLLSSCVAHQPIYPLPRSEVEPPKPTKEYYVVKPGDTLYKIGQEFRINYKELAQWNKIPPPYNLSTNQRLVLSSPNHLEKRVQQNSPSTSNCGKQVRIINPTPFSHPCPPLVHQCTGVHYDIANASVTTKTVTIQYRQLGQIKVLNQNVQIPAKSVIDSRTYEVADKIDEQNIFITCN